MVARRRCIPLFGGSCTYHTHGSAYRCKPLLYKSNPRDVRKIKNSFVLTLGRNPILSCLFVLEGLAISELEMEQ